jgi:hypothetical protein
MRRHLASLGPTLGVLLALAGCTHPRPHPLRSWGWVLVHPPQERDPTFPRGVHLLTRAPVTTWQARAIFDTIEACESRKREDVDRTIDSAWASIGPDAKNDLGVRRAVNARCVPAAQLAAGGATGR